MTTKTASCGSPVRAAVGDGAFAVEQVADADAEVVVAVVVVVAAAGCGGDG